MNGGYINIDASGLDISKTGKQTINGIYKKLLDAKKADKPIFLYNAVSSNYGKTSPIGIYCFFGPNKETIYLETATLHITVNKMDEITIVNSTSPNN